MTPGYIVQALSFRIRRALARVPIPRKRCVLCERSFLFFLSYRGGSRAAPAFPRLVKLTGSDLDNHQCPCCGSHDRERHLLLYLRQAGLPGIIAGKDLLHFAPEEALSGHLLKAGPGRYLQADLYPSRSGIEKVDMTSMPFEDECFDWVIANHVLEHIHDEAAALSEIHRVLRRGGHAILQTPYSVLLEHTFEDPAIEGDELRLEAYGQEDHVRLYGRDIFKRFEAAGFINQVCTHTQALAGLDTGRLGVNPSEPFFLFEKA